MCLRYFKDPSLSVSEMVRAFEQLSSIGSREGSNKNENGYIGKYSTDKELNIMPVHYIND